MGHGDPFSYVILPCWFPATRGLFSFAFAGLTSTGERDLCYVSKLALIQPPSTTFDDTPHANRMRHDMFADCDLSPQCPTHSFTVIPLLLSEPTQHEVWRKDSVAK